MSGALGNGEYKILNRSENGFLAVNSSFIGEEFGLESILINKKDKSFIYKTFINRENNNMLRLVSYQLIDLLVKKKRLELLGYYLSCFFLKIY